MYIYLITWMTEYKTQCGNYRFLLIRIKLFHKNSVSRTSKSYCRVQIDDFTKLFFKWETRAKFCLFHTVQNMHMINGSFEIWRFYAQTLWWNQCVVIVYKGRFFCNLDFALSLEAKFASFLSRRFGNFSKVTFAIWKSSIPYNYTSISHH